MRLSGLSIVIVYPVDPGVDFRLHKAVFALHSEGAQVTIIAPKNEANPSLFEATAKVVILSQINRLWIRHSSSSKRVVRIAWNVLIANPFYWMQARFNLIDVWRRARKFIHSNNPDLVYVVNYPLAKQCLLLKREGVQTIIYETYEYSPGVFQNPKLKNSQRHQRRLAKEEIDCMNSVNGVVVASPFVARRYQEDGVDTQITVVENAAWESPILPSSTHKPLRFYFHSYLRPGYGIEFLLDAFESIRGDWSLTFQGSFISQSYKNAIARLIDSHPAKDRIEILEACDYRCAVTEANKYDVGVFLAPVTEETFFNENMNLTLANKIYVYASAGLAMLYGRHMGTMNYLEGYDMALWVDESNVNDARAKIELMINSPDKVSQMKKNAYKWAQEHDFDSAKTALVSSVLSAVYEKEMPSA